jgi:hypothetical protein
LSRLFAARWKIYWLWFAITLLIYFAMIFWSLPKIGAMAGGEQAFDLRPTGYSFDEARSFMSALGPEGTDFYLHRQQLLDTIYPGMLGVTLVGALIGLDRGGWGWVLSVFAIAGSVFDYLENMAVRTMLLAGGDALTDKMVEDASGWTFLKSACTTIAMSGLLALVLIALWRYMLNKTSVKNLSESTEKKTEDVSQK